MKKLTTKNRIKKNAQLAQNSQFMVGPQQSTAVPFKAKPVKEKEIPHPFDGDGAALSTSGITPGVVENTDPIESGETTKTNAPLSPLPGSKPMLQPAQTVQQSAPAVPQRKNPYEVPF
jgi:hypothetical protein